MKTQTWRNKATISVRELAAVLSIGVNQAYQAVASGEIPSIKLGRSIRISTAVLARILEQGTNKEVA